MKIKAKNYEVFKFRPLFKNDGKFLGDFFDSLSQETRSKFGPHPLNSEYALNNLCSNVGKDNVSRFIVVSEEKIVGYFIVDYNDYPHERERYKSYGINLDFRLDPVFAPCIADEYQSLGVASRSVSVVIDNLKKDNTRSLVLMGGTQEPNIQARNFYKKIGFQELGEFFTEHNGLNNYDMRLVLEL